MTRHQANILTALAATRRGRADAATLKANTRTIVAMTRAGLITTHVVTEHAWSANGTRIHISNTSLIITEQGRAAIA